MREDPKKMGKSKPGGGERYVPGENSSRRFISRVTNDTLIALDAFLKSKVTTIPSVERALEPEIHSRNCPCRYIYLGEDTKMNLSYKLFLNIRIYISINRSVNRSYDTKQPIFTSVFDNLPMGSSLRISYIWRISACKFHFCRRFALRPVT